MTEFAPKPPSAPKAATSRPMDNLVDYEQDLFELTKSKFKPNEPLCDPKHRPVRRIRVWDHHGDSTDGSFAPNLHHLVSQLNDCENVNVDRLKTYAEYHDALKVSNARLDRVRRGCSLYRLLEEEPPIYKPVQPQRRFAVVNDILQKMPGKVPTIPPARHIEFVYPVSARAPERVDLVSKISIAESQRLKLKRVVQTSERQHLQYHNELVDYLNHKNERRMRASQAFYEDIAKYDLKRAELNAKRNSQKSRLRVMIKTQWWEEFIEFAFSERVRREEEKFIERIARKPNLSVKEYYDFLRELESRPETAGRCVELLKWLNNKVHYADEEMVDILRYDEQRYRRPYARTMPA